MIPVASFRPDISPTNSGVGTIAQNVRVIADGNGIAHAPQAGPFVAPTATALPDPPLGAIHAVKSDNTYRTFIGTVDDIYELSSLGELDVSRAVGSGTYNCTATWSTVAFGGDVFFLNENDGLVSIDVDAGTSFAAVSGAPTGRYIFAAFDKLFILNAGGNGRQMRHCSPRDASTWGIGDRGAGVVEFEGGDELIAGAQLTSDFTIVLQRNAANYLVKRADSKQFDTKKLFDNIGCVNPQAFCHIGDVCWWLHTNGFYQFSPSTGLENISDQKVTQWFLGINGQIASGGLDGVQMVADPKTKRIFVRFQSVIAGSSVTFDDILVYDYALKEWTVLKITTSLMIYLASPAVTFDDLTETFDDYDLPFDSPLFRGGERSLSIINGDYKFATLSGNNLEAVSETQEINIGSSGIVSRLTPVSDAGNGTVSISARNALSQDKTWSSEVGILRNGYVPLRVRGGYLSARQTVPAGEVWSFFRGFDDPDKLRAGGRR